MSQVGASPLPEVETAAAMMARLESLEASLHARELELQQARRIARLGTWRWSCETDSAFWSQEVYEILGVDPGLPPLDYAAMQALHTPESRLRRDQAVQKVLEDGAIYEHEMELLLPDGSRRWVVTRGEAAAFNAQGKVTELRGTMQDITERKQIELALRERERELREAHRINRIGTWTTDVPRNSVWWSPEVYRAFAADPSQPPLRPPQLSDLFLNDGYARMEEVFNRAMRTGEPYEVDSEIRALDGTRRWICARGEVSKWGEDGEVLELRGTIQDVTSRKQTEEALRDRERRFRELAESLPQLVWITNSQGGVTYVNQSFERYAGITLAQIEGGHSFDTVHPEDREASRALWERCIATGEPFAMEARLVRHDGVARTFIVRALATRNDRGEIERWIGTAFDIHDRKLADEVIRRTEKLAATGRLAASMAHEINNPLSAVTNSLYLALLDPSLSDTTRAYLEQAEQELARVAAVTTQTLRFHQQSTAPQEVDLGEIMDSAFGLFRTRFLSRGITVQREYRCKERLFCCDGELRQVFANLLSNALDATPPGGRVRVRIHAARSATGEAGVLVTVADTGHGIPKDLQRRVFEPFLSTKAATGTGLGLWVSKSIVERHKGAIRVRSRTAQPAGTVFSLFFPHKGMRP
jgi:PAS domain S-box-containing protein